LALSDAIHITNQASHLSAVKVGDAEGCGNISWKTILGKFGQNLDKIWVNLGKS